MKQRSSSNQLTRLARGASMAIAAAVVAGMSLAPACGGGGTAHPGTSSATDGELDAGEADAGAQLLTDGQILQVLQSATAAETFLGQLAASKASTLPMWTFANQVAAEASAETTQLKGLGTSTRLIPAPSTLSRQFDSQSKLFSLVLNGKTGRDVDTAYAQAQVVRSEQLITVVDGQLLPQATNPQLKAELQTLVQALQLRASAAQALLTQLETQPALPPAPPPAPDGGTAPPPGGGPHLTPDAG